MFKHKIACELCETHANVPQNLLHLKLYTLKFTLQDDTCANMQSFFSSQNYCLHSPRNNPSLKNPSVTLFFEERLGESSEWAVSPAPWQTMCPSPLCCRGAPPAAVGGQSEAVPPRVGGPGRPKLPSSLKTCLGTSKTNSPEVNLVRYADTSSGLLHVLVACTCIYQCAPPAYYV